MIAKPQPTISMEPAGQGQGKGLSTEKQTRFTSYPLNILTIQVAIVEQATDKKTGTFMRPLYSTLLLLSLLLPPLTSWAQLSGTESAGLDPFASEPEFLPVAQAYQLVPDFLPNSEGTDTSSGLQLNWQITEGYYLYRHGFDAKLTYKDQQSAAQLVIPDGIKKQDEYFGEVEVYYHNASLTVAQLPDDAPFVISLTSQGCADAGLCYPPYTQHFEIDPNKQLIREIDAPAATDSAATNGSATTAATDNNSLIYMLVLAMLGGAILNLMPCVFPVLSLKVLAFANDKEHSQAMHGAVYSAGVVSSFIAVAAILVSLQAAGEAIGWGFHLQSPWFVAALTYLFFVMGLSLSGFIELGGGLMNSGAKLADKGGYSGSFFTGVLATVVASPCTAPFMGTALGFAVTQPKAIALLVFAALGLGMALPVWILSCSPKLLSKIPKPGAWMDKLKQILAFPLYATAIWLAWVVGKQTGVNGMAILLLGCLLLALALWLWHGKVIMRTAAAACAAAAIAMLSSPLMESRTINDGSSADWQAYRPEVLAELRQQGKPVFLNITADWCITCLANERVTLSTVAVKQAMSDANMTYLKGDWTNHDPQITALLEQFGRNGIPLYVVYPNGIGGEPTVLPQILSTQTVIDAIAAASERSSALTTR